MPELADNILRIAEKVASASQRSGLSETRILLATKTVSPDRIREATGSGITLLGENRLQELKTKYDALSDLPLDWHMIGHLQSNKVKEAVRYCSVVQSVDRPSIAAALQSRCEFEGKRLKIMLQVNTSAEPSKFGIAPDQVFHLAESTLQHDRLDIIGLMTIGLFSSEESLVRPCYARLRRCAEDLTARGLMPVPKPELSMGMSGDFEWAILEGATIVRIGTAIFGARALPDSYYWPDAAN
jgi:pyridoxal phosphate enzyme (YggS family)